MRLIDLFEDYAKPEPTEETFGQEQKPDYSPWSPRTGVWSPGGRFLLKVERELGMSRQNPHVKGPKDRAEKVPNRQVPNMTAYTATGGGGSKISPTNAPAGSVQTGMVAGGGGGGGANAGRFY